MSRRSVEDWRRAVFKSSMSGNAKVLCLFLADRMNERDKKVSVPRKTIAKALGCHEQRVAERFKAATDAGFLTRVSPGYLGHTAVYQGTWPDPPAGSCVPENSTHDLARESVRNYAGMRTGFQDAITRADLSARGHRPNGGSYDEAEGRQARAPVARCPFHDAGTGALEDCACPRADRRRSA